MLLQRMAKPRLSALTIMAFLAGIALFLTLSGTTFAQEPPPHAFTGSATIDGTVAPDGIVVTAWIDGEQVASTTVSDGEFTLIVEPPAGLSYIGQTITFRVDGLEADATATWEQGGATALDLAVSSEAAITPDSSENTTTVTTTPAEPVERRGLFGQVTGVDGNTLRVQTAQGDIQVQVTASTWFRGPQEEQIGLEAVQPGRRIAAVVRPEGDRQIADQIMLLPDRGSRPQTRTVHVTGVVTETDQGTTVIVTDDGTRVQLEFGLNGGIPASGAVVTIVGRRDSGNGVVRVRATHHLDRTLERLTEHVAQIQDLVPDTNGQLHHLGRVQRILERTSERQLEILERVSEHLPEESRPALSRALQNLQDANRTVVQAFSQALELNARRDGNNGADNGRWGRRLLAQIEPSFADLAEIMGIPEDTLRERLAQGATLLQLAEEAGFTRDSLVEAVLARVRQRLQRLIDEGHITREEAERIIERMREEAGEHLVRVFVDVKVSLPGLPFSLARIAELLGLEPPQLLARLHKGESLLEIARQSGLSREQLIDAIMGLARRHAQQLVDQGAMRQEDVERFLRHFAKEVEERIEEAAFDSEGHGKGAAVTPEDVAAALGVPVYEFMSYMEQGSTLEQLARRRGENVEEVLEKLIERAEERLERLVEQGQITREEAREIIARMRERFREETDRPNGLSVIVSSSATAEVEFRGFPFDPRAVAEALGMTPQELRQRLAQGRKLEDVAREKGVALERLADVLVAEMEVKLQIMVREGQLTEERAREMLARARESILEMLREFRLTVEGEVHAEVRRDRSGGPGPSYRPYAGVPLTMEDAARALGVSYEEVKGATGQEIRALLEERGATPEEFAADLQALVRQRLQQQVARGEVTEEKVASMLEELKQRLLQDLLGHRLEAAAQRRRDGSGASVRAGAEVSTVAPFNLRQVADALGVSPQEIPNLVAQGQSLEDIAAKAGVSLEALVEVSIDPLKARLERLADEGYLHEDQIREKLEEARRSTLQAIEAYQVPGRAQRLAREGGRPEPGVRRDLPREQRPADEMPEMTLEEVRRLLAQGLTSARITAIVDASLDEQVRAGRVSREEARIRREIARQLIDRAVAERPAPRTSAEGRPAEEETPSTSGSRQQPDSPTARQVDPASVLPTLASADDVFEFLGVGAEATALRQRGLALSRVAQQLGFSQESMRLRLRAAAEARVNASVRAGVLASARASELLAAFDRQAATWVEVIFRAEVSTEVTTSATSGLSTGR